MSRVPYDFTTFDIPGVPTTCPNQFLGALYMTAIPLGGVGAWSLNGLDISVCTNITDQADCGSVRMTCDALVTRALRSVGVLDGTEAADAEDLTTGYELIKEILSHWNTGGRFIFTSAEAYVYVAECENRVPLPFRALGIEEIFWLNDVVETPLIEQTRQQYWELPVKGQTGTPAQYHTDEGRSCTDVLIWPTPLNGGWMRVLYHRPIQMPIYQTDVVDLPQEALTGFRFMLAARLADEFLRSGPEIDRIIAKSEQFEEEWFADQGPDVINLVPNFDGRR
jgi:hypothetical protein